MSDTVILYRFGPSLLSEDEAERVEFRTVRWCTTHDEVAHRVSTWSGPAEACRDFDYTNQCSVIDKLVEE